MTDQKYDYRLAALKMWADDVRERGFIAPSSSDLAAIAKAKVPDAPGVDRAKVEPWRGAITELLRLMSFNFSEPHRQLGPEFDTPEVQVAVKSTQGRSAVLVDHVHDPAYLALKRWRDKADMEGRLANSVLKESNLRNLANSGKTKAADIRAILPSTMNHFAEELEEVLGKVRPDGRPTKASAPGSERIRETTTAADPSSTIAAPAATQSPARGNVPPIPLAPPPGPAVVHAEAEPGQLQEDAHTIDPGAFAAYDYTSVVGSLVPLRIRKQADGGTIVSWPSPASDAPVRIYRLVSSDEHPPYAPEHADLVAVTRQEEALDERPLRSAVRHMQVWLNEGLTASDAVSSQPTLLANEAYVAEVQDLNIKEDEGRVVGRWTALPGTTRVHIFRIPMERAAIGAGDPHYRILAESNNLGGFVDSAATRGSSYLYQIHAEAEVDGVAKLSRPIAAPLKLSAILAPVSDLQITLGGDDERPFFDLRWSQPPAGKVVIYRTEQPPTPGIELGIQNEDVLDQAQLKLELRLHDPVEEAQGSALMTSVPWPNGWTRAYFTPVTLLDGLARVGTTIFKSRNEKVRAPKILERVDSQILTFEWPEGADSVLVYRGRSGQDPSVALHGEPIEISKSGYIQRGGLRFPHPLPDEGCDLHLVPITFEAGARVSGGTTSVNYPWILKLSYEATFKRNLLGKITGVSVTLKSRKPVPSPLPFVLVYNPERLPLTGRDGMALSMIKDIDGGPAPVRRFIHDDFSPTNSGASWRTESDAWANEVSPSKGYVRLFVDLPVEAMKQVALLDPPLARLSLSGGTSAVKGLFSGR